MRELLGGKGANLAEMTNLGMPVPQGFTITTEACTRYYDDGRTLAEEIQTEILAALKKLEEITGKTFGDAEKPLLVSVIILFTSLSKHMEPYVNLSITGMTSLYHGLPLTLASPDAESHPVPRNIL